MKMKEDKDFFNQINWKEFNDQLHYLLANEHKYYMNNSIEGKRLQKMQTGIRKFYEFVKEQAIMKGIITTLFLFISVFAYNQDLDFIIEHPELFPYLNIIDVDTLQYVNGTNSAIEWTDVENDTIRHLLWVEKLNKGEPTGEFKLASYTLAVKNLNSPTIASNQMSAFWKQKADYVMNDNYMFIQDARIQIFSSNEGIVAFEVMLE